MESGAYYPTQVVPPETVCAGGMIWGDYDLLTYLNTDANGVGHFIRPFTDSTVASRTGTCNDSGLQHVDALVY